MSDDSSTPEDLLQRAYEVGQKRWPRLALSAEVFIRYLRERLPPADPKVRLAQVLDEQLYVADLYLACACVHNVPEALEALEQHCLMRLRETLKQPAAVVDDVLQQVRVHLLVGTTASGPQLPTYLGQARICSWIRAIAVRMVLHQLAPVVERHDENVLEALAALPAPGGGAELDLIRGMFQRDFKQALREAFAALTRQQRNMLRLYHVDGLTTTELGRLNGESQPTTSRKLARAREAVYEHTRRLLQERLNLSSQSFESLLNVVRSQLDLSIGQLLRDEETESKDAGKDEGAEEEEEKDDGVEEKD
jgi:RNA polymerase sigma-70 factor (ECF subfamily)